jgi:uncharacterized membrane protein
LPPNEGDSAGHTQASDSVGRPRIQGLSDLIFGLALSISALTLISQQPDSTARLAVSLGTFGFSFLILISLWQMYSSVTSILPAETPTLMDLNVILLFLVSIEPYLFNELFALHGGLLTSVTGIYSVDLAGMFFILGFFLQSLCREERHLVPKELLRKFRFRRNLVVLTALIFTLSIYPYFGTVTILSWTSGGSSFNLEIREALWLVALAMSWIRRLVETSWDVGSRKRPATLPRP